MEYKTVYLGLRTGTDSADTPVDEQPLIDAANDGWTLKQVVPSEGGSGTRGYVAFLERDAA
ncbi:DUF4177 domain-containing protein [Aquisalimonas asiatica]|uniref:DUF4177 domain-containing protein n=1 Tax=Aquisalimonas asiatica TaxID=406100 RepID=A0A1H8TPL3_9GAMM|nr:DUF4177 domain-containing protein [Aquisalimonas asiatica]SEO92398.1 protein of unknown function [Aquisalimonas asiatica]